MNGNYLLSRGFKKQVGLSEKNKNKTSPERDGL
jgi:hypothetical protein